MQFVGCLNSQVGYPHTPVYKSLIPTIGVGNIYYMPLIDNLVSTGRPILLPEIPYVSGFRPWQSAGSVLSPAVVASTVSISLRSGISKS